MASNGDCTTSLLSIESITERASTRWDSKTPDDRLKASSKYNHIFNKHNLEKNDWSNQFHNLSRHQRNILLKGELIRTYDAMSNSDKSKIKLQFGLPNFASKWFKLDSKSKKILLTSILKND